MELNDYGRAGVSGGPPAGAVAAGRVAWVDCARGWCIVLVVMMHSALGVGLVVGDTGWLHSAVAFAKPFRMPDFFLVAGLFAGRALDGPWRRLIDGKVVHFAYFYTLWLFIALLTKAHSLGLSDPQSFAAEYAWRLVEPFSTTWFIQLLPLLYLATRFVRRVPTGLLLLGAVSLHLLAASHPKIGGYTMESELTGWTTADGFLLFWIYFLVGVRFRAAVFRLSELAVAHRARAIGFLLIWGAFEAVAVARLWPEAQGLDLPFGLLGATAVVIVAALAAEMRATAWLAYVGQRSLFIYLAFFLPMAASRSLLLHLAPQVDVGTTSLLVTCAAITGPLAMERLLRRSPLAFLFARPGWAQLRPSRAAVDPVRRSASLETSPSAS